MFDRTRMNRIKNLEPKGGVDEQIRRETGSVRIKEEIRKAKERALRLQEEERRRIEELDEEIRESERLEAEAERLEAEAKIKAQPKLEPKSKIKSKSAPETDITSTSESTLPPSQPQDQLDPYSEECFRTLTFRQLRTIRSRINAVLPTEPRKMTDMNLEDELVAQYVALKNLQDDNLNDPDIALNQRAQAANALTGALGSLIKLQTDLKREEKFKVMEAALMEAVSNLPSDSKVEFFAKYREIARQKGLLDS